MISFFKKGATIYVVESDHALSSSEAEKFNWLFDGAEKIDDSAIHGTFVGPRREMITPSPRSFTTVLSPPMKK